MRVLRTGLAAGTVMIVGGASAVGCLDRPVEPVEPRTTSTIVERLAQNSVDKIDLLLAIDNSRSMADKQKILELAVPDLVNRLINPICRDAEGNPAEAQPGNPVDPCPEGTEREFKPITDIHIGIISSSIGGFGSPIYCLDQEALTPESCYPPGAQNTTTNDKGQLLSRTSETGTEKAPTYQDKGFLAWDPEQKLSPPGEANESTLTNTLRSMVIGVGQIGCGFEAQLESVYRFLIDPDPYAKISIGPDNRILKEGTDETLLSQRAAFLRPDSLLAVIMLTDENDCSVREEGGYYQATTIQEGGMPKARSECAQDITDPCCASCAIDPKDLPPECGADPACSDGQGLPLGDSVNLRCHEQKRRFGLDFLYPTTRYSDALQSLSVPDRAGNMVANPIFSDLNPNDDNNTIRDAGLVFFAGIVGVPWQDIARDPSDLTKGFKSAQEMQADLGNGVGSTWDLILGKPSEGIPPKDPLMIESQQPREGTHPLNPAWSPTLNPGGNPINGNEWLPTVNDDLQYACTFPLLEGSQRDCSDPCDAATSCDCDKPGSGTAADYDTNPLCASKSTQQTQAKAYPGLRELQVLKDMGEQGIVASVCPANLSNQGAADFGYRPAVATIVDRLKQALGGQCLPRELKPDTEGNVPCLVLEARRAADGKCDTECKEPGRQPVSASHQAAANAVLQDPAVQQSELTCICELTQLAGSADAPCLAEPSDEAVGQDGWCYVDPAAGIGNAEIVADCPSTERRKIRFVGEGEPKAGTIVFITCSGD